MLKNCSRIQLWSACLGNLFEHFDTALFGFLSPFLAPLIFPEKDPLVALILTYAMIPLGMCARPIGSLIFGYIGDVYGRKQALFLTMAGMAVISGCIALSPTYTQGGIIAPLIFCLGRLLQNVFSAGESMGGAIYLLENIEEKRHDLFSGLYNASTVGGILLASFAVSLLGFFHMLESGWRLLYACGSATAIFGCIIRRKLPSDNLSQPQKISQNLRQLGRVFWQYRTALVLIIVSSGFAYANYSMSLVLMNGFIPLISSLTKVEMMSLNTFLLVFDFCALPFFGWLASRISREKLMLAAALGVAVSAVPFFMVLKGASFFYVIGIRACFVVLGVAFFAPFHAWAQQLIPPQYRYALISLGYAIGSQLLGGPTAAISLWCFKQTNIVSSVSWYWSILACVSSFAILISLKMKLQKAEKVA